MSKQGNSLLTKVCQIGNLGRYEILSSYFKVMEINVQSSRIQHSNALFLQFLYLYLQILSLDFRESNYVA
jgi:hypothetical protein